MSKPLPSAGGSYTRDPKTGALKTREKPTAQPAPAKSRQADTGKETDV
ncbi:hypothetical protein [Litorisediminicola beolgyonensis]|uniref:Multidrug transporter n=1 Tax=Litorisediminicola beolgyonensis TaxID=1173614 RepID=A0ABW3ZIC4_9RHOB